MKQKTAGLGIRQRSFSDEEILRRLLFASVNEACKILKEGKAYRASDIDVMWLGGFGFPRYRGGLMCWADTIGVAEMLIGSKFFPNAVVRPGGEVSH
jgi:3-hydroxyacyl-CoA dehydrogenase